MATKEFISPILRARIENIYTNARKIHFVLWRTAAAPPSAVEAWTRFLTDKHFQFSESTAPDVNLGDVLILPQAREMGEAERTSLTQWLDSGRSLLSTGPMGAGDPKKDTVAFTSTLLGLEFLPNPEHGNPAPTLFTAGSVVDWQLPPGMLLDWRPADDAYLAVEPTGGTGQAAAYESNYLGRRRLTAKGQPVVRAHFLETNKNRLAWLAFDPIDQDPQLADTAVFADLAVAQSLIWAGRGMGVNLAWWPRAQPAAVVMSVDSEDKFDGAENLARVFKTEHVPATFFIVSNELKNGLGPLAVSDPNFEYASHTVDHKLMDKMTLSDQFDEIQLARLAIEQKTRVEVQGFRPPEELFNADTIQAAVQNHVRYFFGDQRLSRLAPVEIAEGRLLFYPRSVLDDFNLTKYHAFDDSASLNSALNEELTRADQIGGAAFFSMHSQLFGQKPYYAWLGEFLHAHRSEPRWYANFRQVTDWWNQRAAVLVLALESPTGQPRVVIENTGRTEVKDLALTLDRPANANNWPTGSQSSARGTGSIVLLPPLGAGKRFEIDFASEMRKPASF